ncbi:MAG: radical SAM protein [Oscillospiraceae bacterium]|nr:radical SAM protein [Oscillospiraceae bacterium]
MDLHNCTVCPRRCGADRYKAPGRCGSDAVMRIARIAPHMWEEPCLSGTRGAGTVFFTGCSLRCVYCQNHDISRGDIRGRGYSPRELADELLRLRDKGVHNIDFVTPTHFVPLIMDTLDLCRSELGIPVVYNSSGYERTETVEALRGYIDIYLPDVKYFSPQLSKELSAAEDYFSYAYAAVKAMTLQVGRPVFDKDGIMQKGVIVRHMILPSHRRDSEEVLRHLAEMKDDILLSLMSQYTPFYKAAEHHGLDRKLSTYEYEKVLAAAQDIGFDGFMQERSSATSAFTPDFS